MAAAWERETWNQPHAINCNRCKHWTCFSVTQGKSGFTAGYHWRGHWEKRRRGKSTWQWRANGPRLHIIWFDLKTDWWEILKGLCTYTAGTCCSQAGAPPWPHEQENSALCIEHPAPTVSRCLTWRVDFFLNFTVSLGYTICISMSYQIDHRNNIHIPYWMPFLINCLPSFMIGIKLFFLIRQISFVCLHPFPGYFIRSGKKSPEFWEKLSFSQLVHQ